MSVKPLSLCRLCMKKYNYNELFKIDNENAALDSVIFFCVDIKMQPGDGLPEVICIDCLRKVRMFYNFKKNCLEVDLRLKHTILETAKHNIDTKRAIGVNDIFSNRTEITPNDCTSPKNNCLESWSEKINAAAHIKKINNFNNIYQCEQCGQTFKLKTDLERHMTVHSGIKPYICKLCHKGFTRAGNRMIHMRSHLEIKPYICETCGRTSTKRSDLIRHMKIHSDEKNYSCLLCNRKFKRSFDVNNHMRTHNGLRPYKCKVCEKTYTSLSGLRKHNKNYCKND